MRRQSLPFEDAESSTFRVDHDGRIKLAEMSAETQAPRDVTGDVIVAVIKMLEITGSLSVETQDGRVKEISLSTLNYMRRILH